MLLTTNFFVTRSLCSSNERELIRILTEHKGAIRWLVVDLKGISPTICMHRIYLEGDDKPVRKMQ